MPALMLTWARDLDAGTSDYAMSRRREDARELSARRELAEPKGWRPRTASDVAQKLHQDLAGNLINVPPNRGLALHSRVAAPPLQAAGGSPQLMRISTHSTHCSAMALSEVTSAFLRRFTPTPGRLQQAWGAQCQRYASTQAVQETQELEATSFEARPTGDSIKRFDPAGVARKRQTKLPRSRCASTYMMQYRSSADSWAKISVPLASILSRTPSSSPAPQTL